MFKIEILGDNLGKKYDFYVMKNNERNELYISLSKMTEITKYPKEDEYTFLYRDYYGALAFRENEDYQALLNKYINQGLDLKIKNKGPKHLKTEEYKGIELSDKSLMYVHGIDLVVDASIFSNEILSDVKKLFL